MWSLNRAFSSGGKNDTFVGDALRELLPPIASFMRLTSCRSNNNCRSISSRSACSDDWFTMTGRLSFLICWDEPSLSSTISTVIRSPFCRTSILSTKFFNSRTLPGQLKFFMTRIASGMNPRYGISFPRVNSRANRSTSSEISSTR